MLRRLQLGRGAVPVETVARLAWGDEIEVDPREMIGSAICRMGVYDLVVVEAIWRLTDREDVALDVGANIGAMTSAFLARCSRVWAYEPHPQLFERLTRNGARWAAEATCPSSSSRLELRRTGRLDIPSDFSANSGTAALASSGERVRVLTLDGSLPRTIVPAIAKVDVEGHEKAVIDGGTRTFECLRDVIFEDHNCYPSELSSDLEERGFRIFGLQKRLLRPALVDAAWRPGTRGTLGAFWPRANPAVPLSGSEDGWRALSGR